MVAVVLLAAAFLFFGGKIVRWQAIVLLALYLVTIPFTISTEEEAEATSASVAAVLDEP